VKNKLEILEERLRAIKGGGSYGFRDTTGLCLVPNVMIPLKFKVSEFEKNNGTSCPKIHLTIFAERWWPMHTMKICLSIFSGQLSWYDSELVHAS